MNIWICIPCGAADKRLLRAFFHEADADAWAHQNENHPGGAWLSVFEIPLEGAALCILGDQPDIFGMSIEVRVVDNRPGHEDLLKGKLRLSRDLLENMSSIPLGVKKIIEGMGQSACEALETRGKCHA